MVDLAHRQIKIRQYFWSKGAESCPQSYLSVNEIDTRVCVIHSLLHNNGYGATEYYSPALAMATKMPLLAKKEVEEANAGMKEVLEVDKSSEDAGRGKYNDYMAEERGMIGKYAAEHGPAKAARYYSKLLGRKSRPSLLICR